MNSKFLRLLFGVGLIALGAVIIIARPSSDDTVSNNTDTVEQGDTVDTQSVDVTQQESLDESVVDESTTETEPEEPTQPEPEVVQAPVVQPGAYIDYSEAALASSQGTNILFFHADWCIQCRTLENDIKEGDIPEGVTVLEVDFDNSTDLRQRYGVTLQTTLVSVDSQGNELGRFNGFSDPSAEALYSALL